MTNPLTPSEIFSQAPCLISCSSNRAARNLREKLYRHGAREKGWRLAVRGVELEIQRRGESVTDVRSLACD